MSEPEFKPKIQAAVVAEVVVELPTKETFVCANFTVQFVSTMRGAEVRALEIVEEIKRNAKTEHALLIGGIVGTIEDTTAVGCKVRVHVSAFPVRIQEAPPAKPKSGWGSNGN